jgi:hypothetical protein
MTTQLKGKDGAMTNTIVMGRRNHPKPKRPRRPKGPHAPHKPQRPIKVAAERRR